MRNNQVPSSCLDYQKYVETKFEKSFENDF